MKYISTRSKEKEYSFGEVFLKGLADDGGLYVPKSLKKYNTKELSELKNLNFNELSTDQLIYLGSIQKSFLRKQLDLFIFNFSKILFFFI